jgi:hypothetical protein
MHNTNYFKYLVLKFIFRWRYKFLIKNNKTLFIINYHQILFNTLYIIYCIIYGTTHRVALLASLRIINKVYNKACPLLGFFSGATFCRVRFQDFLYFSCTFLGKFSNFSENRVRFMVFWNFAGFFPGPKGGAVKYVKPFSSGKNP